MKKNTVQKYLPRVIAGLVLLGLAVLMGFSLSGFTGPQSTMLQRTIYVTAVFGVGLGGLLCMAFGFWGVLGGIAFVLVTALPRALPEPWNRYFAIVYLLFLLGLKPLRNRLSKKKAATACAEVPKEALPQDETDTLLPKDSVIANNSFSGRIYQLFRRAGQVVGYRVGGEIRGVDTDKIRHSSNGIPDFVYSLDEIQKITAKPHNLYGTCITFRAGGHTYYFVPTAFSTGEELEDFFRLLAPDQIPQKQKTQPTIAQVQRRNLLSKLRTALIAAIALIGLPWMFLDVPYKLFATLSLLPGLATLALICIFPEDITLEEKKKDAAGRMEMITPLVFSGIAPCLRTMFDFNILDWPRLLIFAAIELVVILAALIVCNKPLRSKVGTLLGTVLLCIFFAIGSVGQMNYLLDFSQPQTQTAQIFDMHISTSSRSPDRHILKVALDDGTELELNVSKSEYEALAVGDRVSVITFAGGLGIPYAFIG